MVEKFKDENNKLKQVKLDKVKGLFDKFTLDISNVHSDHNQSIDQVAERLMKHSEQQKGLKMARVNELKSKIEAEQGRLQTMSWEQLEEEFSAIKEKFNDISTRLPSKSNKADVRLNVGGQSFVVGMDTLTSVDGSLLQDFFTENFKNEKIFIDREPEAFREMLKYLRSDRKYVPKNLAPDVQSQFEMEIKHWKVDNGLKQFDQLTYTKLQWRIMNMLKSTPKIDEKKS